MNSARVNTEHLLTAIRRVVKIAALDTNKYQTPRVRLEIDPTQGRASAISRSSGIVVSVDFPIVFCIDKIDVCIDPLLTIDDIELILPCCRIEADVDAVQFYFGTNFASHRVRVKRPSQHELEFPSMERSSMAQILQLEIAPLKRLAEFVATPVDATDPLHINVKDGTLTAYSQGRLALHRAALPIHWLTDYPSGLASAFTVQPRSLNALCSLTGSRIIALGLDHATMPTQITALLEGGLRATIRCQPETIEMPYVPPHYAWRLYFDSMELASALKGTRQRDDVTIEFSETSNAALLYVIRVGQVERVKPLTFSGLHPGNRTIRVDAVAMRDAIKHLGKNKPGQRRKLGKEIALYFDAMHRLIEWRSDNLIAKQARVGDMFPLVVLPKDEYRVGWQDEDYKQNEDRKAAKREYEQWLTTTFTPEQITQMKNRDVIC